MSEEDIISEILSQEKELQFWQCPACGLTFDSDDELDEHLEKCPVFNEKKQQVESAKDVIKEHQEEYQKFREKIKLEILANASLEELRLFLMNPEALEKRVDDHMIGEALKHPFVRAETTFYEGFRNKQISEAMETLRLGVCPVCKQACGSENGLLKHLEAQIELGEENHRKAKEYIDIVLSPDEVIKEFLKKKDSTNEETSKDSIRLSKEDLAKFSREEERKQRLKEAVILAALLRNPKRKIGRPKKQ